MVQRVVWSVLGAVGLLGATTGVAKDTKWTHYGLRPLAMGNAYVAVADDYNALFYNPAGMARLKEWTGEFLNPGLELSKNTVTFANDLSKFAGGSNAEGTKGVLELLEGQTGKNQHLALQWTPHLIFPGFGFGLGLDFNTTLAIHREISADLDVGPRVIVPFSLATNFFEDRLSVGTTVKLVARGGVDREFSIQDIEAFSKKDETKTDAEKATEKKIDDYVEGGVGAGVDVGLLFTPEPTMEPTLGISITDVGGTPYKQQDVGGTALGAPDVRLPAVNTGLSLKPWKSGDMYLLGAVDVHAINQPYSYSKKVNYGMEWGFMEWIKFDVGLHQGYLTGGFQFDVPLLTIRAVTYSEELGETAGQNEDRRYALQLKLLI
jgi:hypothetical protein